MIMRRTRRKYRKNIIELSAFRIWRCYGLNLMCLPENHVLNTRQLACGSILRSIEPSRRRSWLTEAGDLGGNLKVMPILGADCLSKVLPPWTIPPLTWCIEMPLKWRAKMNPSALKLLLSNIFDRVTRIWANTCREEKLGSQSRP